jgi:uncharacterized protein YndB with AHSA1/START domain
MTTTNNEVQKPDDATLVVRRVLNATPEWAFQAWTSAEHIQQWMRPEPGMVVPLASMDLRVGGKYRIQVKTPDGEFFTAVGVFKGVKAPERLVYTWDWEKDGSGAEFGEVEGKPSLVTVEFLRRGERTEMVLTHSRFATVESRDRHARGWGKIAESFAEFVQRE